MDKQVEDLLSENLKVAWDLTKTETKEVINCIIDQLKRDGLKSREIELYGCFVRANIDRRVPSYPVIEKGARINVEKIFIDNANDDEAIYFLPTNKNKKILYALLTFPRGIRWGADLELPEMSSEKDKDSYLYKSSGPTQIAPAPPNNYLIPISFITNREKSNSKAPNHIFKNKRGENISFGKVAVSIPSKHKLGKFEKPSIIDLWEENPSKHIMVRTIDIKKESSFFADIKDLIKNENEKTIFLFVHGYNVTFAQAAKKMGQIFFDIFCKVDSDNKVIFNVVPVLYSWPSSGKLRSYFSDRETCNVSKDHFRENLLKLINETGATRIILMAHSMGCNLISEALNDLYLSQQQTKNFPLKEVILAAPDIDKQRFSQLAGNIKKVCERLTLYASDNDRPLKISRIMQGIQRAGDVSPNIFIAPFLDSIDATNVGGNILAHSYYSKKNVLSDIHSMVVGKLAPKDRFALKLLGSPPNIYWQLIK